MQIPFDLKKEIEQLFRNMDQAYDQTARQLGFQCHGCEDNCCRTYFHHYTLMELLYLKSGLAALPKDHQCRIMGQARQADRQTASSEREGGPVRVMCPLNEEGRCVLYGYRPMICRLHGIPHLLQRPDGGRVTGPGCGGYYEQCGNGESTQLNRTPLYAAMAGLERRLRDRLGFHQKIRLTVAQMLIDDAIMKNPF